MKRQPVSKSEIISTLVMNFLFFVCAELNEDGYNMYELLSIRTTKKK